MQHVHFAGTEKRLEVDAQREAIESEWSTKSRYILSELGTACSAFAPAEQERAQAHGWLRGRPLLSASWPSLTVLMVPMTGASSKCRCALRTQQPSLVQGF